MKTDRNAFANGQIYIQRYRIFFAELNGTTCETKMAMRVLRMQWKFIKSGCLHCVRRKSKCSWPVNKIQITYY